MSRRQLSLVVLALASLVVSACSASPTAPVNGIRTPDALSSPDLTAPDTTNRSGWNGSTG